jgi:hypothetical protein
MYTLQEKKLANEIAEALNDREALTLYLAFTRKYHEAFLRKILVRVLSVPEEKIKKTRGALFTYLIGQHGEDNTNNFRR